MTISDRTRKILWGKSGNRCAYCKTELIMDGSHNDPAAVIGDECHIIRLDFTSDYVCQELYHRKTKYLRLNRDQFHKYQVSFNVDAGEISIEIDNIRYYISQSDLKAIYYRAPIYPADNYLLIEYY